MLTFLHCDLDHPCGHRRGQTASPTSSTAIPGGLLHAQRFRSFEAVAATLAFDHAPVLVIPHGESVAVHHDANTGLVAGRKEPHAKVAIGHFHQDAITFEIRRHDGGVQTTSPCPRGGLIDTTDAPSTSGLPRVGRAWRSEVINRADGGHYWRRHLV